MRPLEGLFTAMVTPFPADGPSNEDGALALGRHLLANGSDGLVVCGTTGESPTLSDDEMVSLVELMVEELGVGGARSPPARAPTPRTTPATWPSGWPPRARTRCSP